MAWAALGLRPDARPADVKHAYRSLLRAYHPDTGSGDADLLEKVQKLYRQVTKSWAGRDRDARTRAAASDAARETRAPQRTLSHVDVYRLAGTASPAATLDVLA